MIGHPRGSGPEAQARGGVRLVAVYSLLSSMAQIACHITASWMTAEYRHNLVPRGSRGGAEGSRNAQNLS